MASEIISVQDCVENNDYVKALKILNNNDTEINEAILIKIYCLILNGNYNDALTALNQNNFKSYRLEKAYCQFKMDKVKEALEMLKALKDVNIEHQDMKGQLLYKLEDYGHCTKLYFDIMSHSDFYKDERCCNLMASLFYDTKNPDNLQMFETKKLTFDSYDALFNLATLLLQINTKNVTSALKHLQTAEKLIGNDESWAEERFALRGQMAYALQISDKQVDNEKSMEIYQQLLKNEHIEPANKILLHFNAWINKGNLGDNKNELKNWIKRLEDFVKSDDAKKQLSLNQYKDLYSNLIICNIKLNQIDSAKHGIENYKTKFNPLNVQEELDINLLTIALLCQSKKYTEALDIIKIMEGTQKDILNPELFALKLKLLVKLKRFNESKDYLQSQPNYYTNPKMVENMVWLCKESKNFMKEDSPRKTPQPINENLLVKKSKKINGDAIIQSIEIANIYLKAFLSAFQNRNNALYKYYMIKLWSTIMDAYSIVRKLGDKNTNSADQPFHLFMKNIIDSIEILTSEMDQNTRRDFSLILYKLCKMSNDERSEKYLSFLTEKGAEQKSSKNVVEIGETEASHIIDSYKEKVFRSYVPKKKTERKPPAQETVSTGQTDVLVNVVKAANTKGTHHSQHYRVQRNARNKRRRLAHITAKKMAKGEMFETNQPYTYEAAGSSMERGIDPERWLPRHLRTSNNTNINTAIKRGKGKKKGNKGKDDINKGTQGAVPSQEEENALNQNDGKQGLESNKAPLVGNVSKNVPIKKKKKKGGKW